MTEQTTQSIELVTNKLDSYIQILAEKLGVAAEYVYPLFVKQQIIEGWWFFTSLFIFSSIGAIGLFKAVKYGKKNEWRGNTPLPTVFSFIYLFSCIMPFAIGGMDHFAKIVNPEYAAIQAIIQSVK
jgi:hypothetical protein